MKKGLPIILMGNDGRSITLKNNGSDETILIPDSEENIVCFVFKKGEIKIIEKVMMESKDGKRI